MRFAPLAALLVAGCALVDQRTFDARAGRPPVPPPPPAAKAPPSNALITIRFGQDTNYDSAIRQAVAAVLAKKRDAIFTVTTAVPPGTPEAESAAVSEVTADASRVARLIEASGVPLARVQLEARAIPGLAARELRIYVR